MKWKGAQEHRCHFKKNHPLKRVPVTLALMSLRKPDLCPNAHVKKLGVWFYASALNQVMYSNGLRSRSSVLFVVQALRGEGKWGGEDKGGRKALPKEDGRAAVARL